MMNHKTLEKVLGRIPNRDQEPIGLDLYLDLYNDDALKEIAQNLNNGKKIVNICFHLGKNEKIEGLTALMQALKINKNIKKIELVLRKEEQPISDSSLKIFMDAIKENNNIITFTLSASDCAPTKDFLDMLYNMLEKQQSIKKIVFSDHSRTIDFYLPRFLKLKNLTSIDLGCSSCFDCKTFFSNLNIPDNFTEFKVKYREYFVKKNIMVYDSSAYASLLEAVKKSKITKFRLYSPEFYEVKPYKILIQTLKEKKDLTSLALDGMGETQALCARQGFLSFFWGKSYIEYFFDFLRKTTSLKKLSIKNIHFMSQYYNMYAFCDALNANRSLTSLKLRGICSSRDERNWCPNELIDAIFSNPNLKSLELSDSMDKASVSYFMKKLKYNRTLTELDFSCRDDNVDYIDNLHKLVFELLKENTALESCRLQKFSLNHLESELCLEAIKNNTTRNLVRFKIDTVHPDINAELERNYQLKKLKTINTLLRGVYCNKSSLNVLKGYQGPLALIYGFLYEREESKKTLETKEIKEMRELKELQENQGKCVGLKKSKEEALMIKQSQAKRGNNCNS